jgi:hypothetical protein
LIPEVDKFTTVEIPESIEITQQLLDEKIKDHQQESTSKLTCCICLKNGGGCIGVCGILLGSKKYVKAKL